MFETRLRGAKAEGLVNVPGTTHTPAALSIKIWDSDGYFGPEGTTEVFTIPTPRRAGRYQIRVAIRWMNPWAGVHGGPPYPAIEELTQFSYHTYLTVNDQGLGNAARATANPVRAATGTTQYFAVDTNLNAGDRVGLHLYHGFGSAIDASVVFEIRRLGRKPLMNVVASAPGGPTIDVG